MVYGPWDERKARGGEARGLRVTCHRFPEAKLAEPCPFLPFPRRAERLLRFYEGRKDPEILLSKLRMEKRGQVPAVHGATLRVPFRDFPTVGFVRSRKSYSLLNPSGIARPAVAGFAVILTAKSHAVGTTASRHSQDGCVPMHDSAVPLPGSSERPGSSKNKPDLRAPEITTPRQALSPMVPSSGRSGMPGSSR